METIEQYAKFEPIPVMISLRDYFAGQALAGMMAHPHTRIASENVAKKESRDGTEIIALSCYEYADAMLKQR